MAYSPATEQLIMALQNLPGVGPRSAVRLAMFLLEQDRNAASKLSASLARGLECVDKCTVCRTLTEQGICDLCNDPARSTSSICVVASDFDRAGFEMAKAHKGRYFVLHGVLSPMNNKGPEMLGLFQLRDWVQHNPVEEVILALDHEMESEATVHYIVEQLKPLEVKISRVNFLQMKSGELDKTPSRVILNAFLAKTPLVG